MTRTARNRSSLRVPEADVIAALGMTARALRRHRAAGLPSDTRPGRRGGLKVFYESTEAVRRWLRSRGLSGRPGRPRGDGLDIDGDLDKLGLRGFGPTVLTRAERAELKDREQKLAALRALEDLERAGEIK